jgi:hypothetical protein
MSVLHSPTFENFDSDRNGFFSWAEILPVLTERADGFFRQYKDLVLKGTVKIDDQIGLNQLLKQKTQTPQAFDLGSKFIAQVKPMAVRKPRFGALLRENYGFGVMVDEVVDGMPSSRVRVLGQVNGVPTERIAPLVHGDTILVAHGVQINSVESFLRVLDGIPQGGSLLIEGSDAGNSLNSRYRAEVLLDRQ